jgi:L-aminopeptidase/D-esterase-like protein
MSSRRASTTRPPPRLRADVITDVPGVLAGHWTGEATGVTVVVFPPETVGSVEIRGGAPATRETAVLDPLATVEHVDAIVLSGGSAFGLATADGVMRALAELGRGFPTRGGPVPIVPAAAIFDLVVAGDERPGAEEGRAALAIALSPDAPALATGRIGAGRGASVAKWRGGEHGATGGVGSASARDGEVVVGALVVVNAVGDIVGGDGRSLVASQAPDDAPGFPEEAPFEGDSIDGPSGGPGAGAGTNTTIAIVVTNARCTKVQCHLIAQSANHGLARAIHPSHTRHDGDLAFACATGAVDAHLDRLRVMATEVTAEAVRDAVAYHRDAP